MSSEKPPDAKKDESQQAMKMSLRSVMQEDDLRVFQPIIELFCRHYSDCAADIMQCFRGFVVWMQKNNKQFPSAVTSVMMINFFKSIFVAVTNDGSVNNPQAETKKTKRKNAVVTEAKQIPFKKSNADALPMETDDRPAASIKLSAEEQAEQEKKAAKEKKKKEQKAARDTLQEWLQIVRTTVWTKPASQCVSRQGISHTLREHVSPEVVTACKNNVWMNFRKRHLSYLRAQCASILGQSIDVMNDIPAEQWRKLQYWICCDTRQPPATRQQLEADAPDWCALYPPNTSPEDFVKQERARIPTWTGRVVKAEGEKKTDDASMKNQQSKKKTKKPKKKKEQNGTLWETLSIWAVQFDDQLSNKWWMFLNVMVHMSQTLENAGQRPFAVTPLQRGYVPKSMKLTTEVVKILVTRARQDPNWLGSWRHIHRDQEFKADQDKSEVEKKEKLADYVGQLSEDEQSCWHALFSNMYDKERDTEGRRRLLDLKTQTIEQKSNRGDQQEQPPPRPKRFSFESNVSLFRAYCSTDGVSISLHTTHTQPVNKAKKKPYGTGGRKRKRATHMDSGSPMPTTGIINIQDIDLYDGLREHVEAKIVQGKAMPFDPGKHELLSGCTLDMKKWIDAALHYHVKEEKKEAKTDAEEKHVRPGEPVKPNKAKLTVPDIDDLRNAIQPLRYTANQRRFNSKQTVFQHRKQQLLAQKEHLAVKHANERLSNTVRNTAHLDRYLTYVQTEQEVRPILRKFYSQPEFRVMRYVSWKQGKKSDTEFVREIVRRLGPKPVLFIGDWSKSHMNSLRGMAPVPGIGLRRRLARDCLVINVPEAFSSQRCCLCLQEMVEPPIKRAQHVDIYTARRRFRRAKSECQKLAKVSQSLKRLRNQYSRKARNMANRRESSLKPYQMLKQTWDALRHAERKIHAEANASLTSWQQCKERKEILRQARQAVVAHHETKGHECASRKQAWQPQASSPSANCTTTPPMDVSNSDDRKETCAATTSCKVAFVKSAATSIRVNQQRPMPDTPTTTCLPPTTSSDSANGKKRRSCVRSIRGLRLCSQHTSFGGDHALDPLWNELGVLASPRTPNPAEPTRPLFWNRDLNGALNIWFNALSFLHTGTFRLAQFHKKDDSEADDAASVDDTTLQQIATSTFPDDGPNSKRVKREK